jgi:hypothetical protein
MNKGDQLISNQHLNTNHFVNKNTQQKYDGHNECNDIAYLFQIFNSLGIFYGKEVQSMCFYDK